jgi:hypothetical protein
MNWIEIDKLLYKMIDKHQSVEDVYAEAGKYFKWDLGQARTAIDPLIKRHSKLTLVTETPNPKTVKAKQRRSK